LTDGALEISGGELTTTGDIYVGSFRSPEDSSAHVRFDESAFANLDMVANGGICLHAGDVGVYSSSFVRFGGVLLSNTDLVFECDGDNNGSNKFSWTDGASAEKMSLTEAGVLTVDSVVSALTGQADTVATITGLAPDTATTQVAQGNITSATALPWTGLKPGTDGEIPTFDASGNPAFVAVGTATHVLTSNGVDTAPTFQAASGGGGGLAWEVISGADTATSGEGFLIDSSGGVVTLTLPSTPSEGDTVAVCDYTNSATTNAITIGRNSSNIESVAADLVIDVDGAGFTLVYSDATRGWVIVTEI